MNEQNFKKLVGMDEKDCNLQFTAKDRQEVFYKLSNISEAPIKMKSSILSFKLMPTFITALALGICLFLFLPSFLSDKSIIEEGNGIANEQSNTMGIGAPIDESKTSVTSLLTIKSKEMDNRLYINLLLTYDKALNSVKVISLPTDLLVPEIKEDQTIGYNKLLFAYQKGGVENVQAAISTIFERPIDHFVVIDLEHMNALTEAVNGVPFEVLEGIRTRGVTTQAFEFKKGMQQFNGEQTVALMMAATEGYLIEENSLETILTIYVNKVKSEISNAQFDELFANIETNVSLDDIYEKLRDIKTVELVSLKEALRDDIFSDGNDEQHIYKLEQEIKQKILDEQKMLEKNTNP